jgi:hypothetical protein
MKLKLVVPVVAALAMFAAVPTPAKAGGHSSFSIGFGYSNYGYGGGYNVGFGYSNYGHYGHGYYGRGYGYYGRPYYSFGYRGYYGGPCYYPSYYYAPRYYSPAYYAPAPAPVVYAPAPVYRETVIYRPVTTATTTTRVDNGDGSVTYISTYNPSTYRPVYQSNYNYDRR